MTSPGISAPVVQTFPELLYPLLPDSTFPSRFCNSDFILTSFQELLKNTDVHPPLLPTEADLTGPG